MSDAERSATPIGGTDSPMDSPSKSLVQTPEEGPRESPLRSPATQKSKIDVLLKAAGDAPIMKKKKWAVDKSKRVAWIVEFIKKYIKCESSESLFLYVNQSFSPSPDTDVGTLYECFGSDGKLVLHYCKSQAWG